MSVRQLSVTCRYRCNETLPLASPPPTHHRSRTTTPMVLCHRLHLRNGFGPTLFVVVQLSVCTSCMNSPALGPQISYSSWRGRHATKSHWSGSGPFRYRQRIIRTRSLPRWHEGIVLSVYPQGSRPLRRKKALLLIPRQHTPDPIGSPTHHLEWRMLVWAARTNIHRWNAQSTRPLQPPKHPMHLPPKSNGYHAGLPNQS